MSVWVVVGGQFGSEGQRQDLRDYHRTRKDRLLHPMRWPQLRPLVPKANGEMILLRQLPTGFVRPETRLLIPAGGLVDLDVLRSELETLRLGADRVGVDRNTMVITSEDREQEHRLAMSERLSSTLCGVGSAVAAPCSSNPRR